MFLSYSILLLDIVACFGVKIHTDKLTVLSFDQKPLTAKLQDKALGRLEKLIIENFAHKFKLDIDYFTVNESLSFIFANEENLNAFSNISLLRYSVANI